MDSEYVPDGRLLDIVDDAWRKDKLPHDDIAVPQAELPDVFADDGMSAETIKEQEEKWTDLALQNLHDPQGSGQGS
ncbi:anaphase-promoting complex subunit 13-like [Asterias rubens]|uniref:anaphase-promoting complex subunit 13-like n=1 Tax=Asterias rubens TaxID=7604 RepID=UPI001455B2D1|nr:anaphase-promoting complex subunit 13-like [Asterias rubens]